MKHLSLNLLYLVVIVCLKSILPSLVGLGVIPQFGLHLTNLSSQLVFLLPMLVYESAQAISLLEVFLLQLSLTMDLLLLEVLDFEHVLLLQSTLGHLHFGDSSFELEDLTTLLLVQLIKLGVDLMFLGKHLLEAQNLLLDDLVSCMLLVLGCFKVVFDLFKLIPSLLCIRLSHLHLVPMSHVGVGELVLQSLNFGCMILVHDSDSFLPFKLNQLYLLGLVSHNPL